MSGTLQLYQSPPKFFFSARLAALGPCPRPSPYPPSRPRPRHWTLVSPRLVYRSCSCHLWGPFTRSSRVLPPGPGPTTPLLQDGVPRPGTLPRSWLTCQCRSEAEGVVAVTAAIAGPVAADAWPPMTPTRGARVKHRVAHRALQQPAGVAPVQPLGPRWRRRGRGEGKSPEQACWDRCAAPGGQSGIRYSPWYS